MNSKNEFKMDVFSKEELIMEFEKIQKIESKGSIVFENLMNILSNREMECVKLFMKGNSNIMIAKKN